MKPNQWLSVTFFQSQALPEKLNLLLVRREMFFHQQQEVLGRLAELACQKRELIERQTIHELNWHVFWRRLRQSTCAQHTMRQRLPFTSEPLSGGNLARTYC